MDKTPIFSPTNSGRMVYLPFILLLIFASVFSEVSGMKNNDSCFFAQDSILKKRMPAPPQPPKAPSLNIPDAPAAPFMKDREIPGPPPAPKPPVLTKPAVPPVPKPPVDPGFE